MASSAPRDRRREGYAASMLVVRSIAFGVLVYAGLLLFLLVFLPFFLVSSDEFAWKWTQRWGRSSMWLHRAVVGADTSFDGLENIPAGASIIASKHQSFWETLAFVATLDRPAFILKKELMGIPLFGSYLRRLGMIPVDRSRRGATMASMIEGARRAVGEGRPIVIFPEGTRTLPGEGAEPRPGVFVLYSELGVPVVPAALNSGLFWPRRTGHYRPGTIHVRFLPAIPPGLARPELLQRIRTAVEDAAVDLLRVAYAERPDLPKSAAVAEALATGRSRMTTASSQRSASPSAAISANEERT